MAQRIIIPRLGQTMTEGTVAKWYKENGQQVEAGEKIYEMEYDKASAPVDAKISGTLVQFCEEGSVVPVGHAVGVILEAGEKLENISVEGEHEVANSKLAAEKKQAGSGTGQGPAVKMEQNQNRPSEYDADILVIGGGPGGYVAAIKAAMLGAKVILIEKDTVGGTCLNRGCIPTKALLQCAEVFTQAKSSAPMGIMAADVKLDTKKVNAYKQNVVNTLVKGVEGLLGARKIKVVKGVASFENKNVVQVKTVDGKKERLSADNIIIAAGSEPFMPAIKGIDGKNVITSTEALEVDRLPAEMVVIGGGVIGMELGAAYSDFGVKITVIEAMERILPGIDEEIAGEYTRCAEGKMDIHTGAMVESIEDDAGKKLVRYREKGEVKEVRAEKVLVCVGRKPDTKELCLEKIGVKEERGRIIVGDEFETNIEGVYCIGDANGKCMLAHAASAQGIYLAHKLTGTASGVNLDIVPSCIYTDPEIAGVGLTEQQAKEANIDYKVGRFVFRANGRSLVLGKTKGFVKIIGGAKYGEVLGIHIIGPYATELIAGCAVAMKLEACVEDIANTIHAHPTVSESIMEAAEGFLGGAIHSV